MDTPGLTIRIEGSVSTILPDPEIADGFWAWCEEKIASDTMDEEPNDHLPWQTWGAALVVETNYLYPLIRGLQEDGYRIKA